VAAAHSPDEFYELVAQHLPPERPVSPRGGRTRVANRVVTRVIRFVLATGNRWEDVPPNSGAPQNRPAGLRAWAIRRLR
jgi:transposase